MVTGKIYPMHKKLILMARQTNPDSPGELIRQYQVVANILRYYARSSHRRPAIPNDNYFRNVDNAHGFSIVDSWTNLKKLLKRRT